MAEGRPSLVIYECPDRYRDHYLREYCSKQIYTSDGIRVHFAPRNFEHAFFEEDDACFSPDRAKRIDWIVPALVSPESKQFFGWKDGSDRLDRRVALYEGFAVVLQLTMGKRGVLKAEFLTCFPADRDTRAKIATSSPWRKDLALSELEGRRKEGRRGKR